MTTRLRSPLLTARGILLFSLTALGWGTGHRCQMELVFDRLNPRLGDFFPPEQRDQVIKDCADVPDSTLVLDEAKSALRQ